MGATVAEINRFLQSANADEVRELERLYATDSRKGVAAALARAHRRLVAEAAEQKRLRALYDYERSLARAYKGHVVVGLDEVGRGSLAGPLAVGAVVLPCDPLVAKLNDSKQISPHAREVVAASIKDTAVAWAVEYVEASYIDAHGMTAGLKAAFQGVVAQIERSGIHPDIILLDGNPLHFDEREVNVIKGDARCASVAAASIVAKVERDALMCRYAEKYPEYGFDSCKGYASPAHIEAIKRCGLSPLHRVSFCTAFIQPSLF